jgi:hypothetical protein
MTHDESMRLEVEEIGKSVCRFPNMTYWVEENTFYFHLTIIDGSLSKTANISKLVLDSSVSLHDTMMNITNCILEEFDKSRRRC